MKIKLLASTFQPYWDIIEDGCTKRHPSTLQFVLQQHLIVADPEQSISKMDLELLWLAGLHCSNSSMSTFYSQLVRNNDLEIHKERPIMFLVMENILSALDQCTPEDLVRIIESTDGVNVDLLQIKIMTIESIIIRKKYELLDKFPVDGHTATFISYRRFYTMFCSALRDNKVAELNSLIAKFSPSLQAAVLQHTLLEIFDDWVLEGDLHSMILASTYLLPLLKDYQKRFLNLAKQVFLGNWRYLMVFMELNPNRIIMADAAWRIILCERPSDSVFNMIVDAQLSNQEGLPTLI
jgi:hypothetical protein